MEKRCEILCSGVVQGVGMRPFVYRIAVKNNLVGYVLNLGDAGVKIVVEGEERNIRKFMRELREKKPPLARFEKIKVKWGRACGEFKTFTIEKSSDERVLESSYIPPDVAICDNCIRDMLNPDDRHYRYAFTCCADCGPRYTSIMGLPYDRELTTMRNFPLCPYCMEEYANPMDRRYHAQGICCPLCGPKITLHARGGEPISCMDPIAEAAKLINEGAIVAVKGIGGSHLVALTTDDECVLKLRQRKRDRKYKPFAVMSLSLDEVRKYAEVSQREEEVLTSFRRPIVLLRKKDDFPLSEWISPGLHNIGVMLPYSGLHILLLQEVVDPAVIMTSGNISGKPIAASNEEIITQLSSLADYFLLHNRVIYQRCDDSVVKVVDGKTKLIRRSRGYVPEPIETRIPYKGSGILAVGSELTVTVAVMKRNKCYVSQHIGDVSGDLDMVEFHESVVIHLLKLLNVKPEAIACDLHPRFVTTRIAEEYAERWQVPVVRVQHHHAHATALKAEHNINEPIVCIASDGVGYGPDGTIWGGEILLSDYSSSERLGHLAPQIMPGGDQATKYPMRMAASILSRILSNSELREILTSRYIDGFKYGEREVEFVLKMTREARGPITTSTGRVLDAIAALLRICMEKTYQGEPAMRLEAAAARGKPTIKIEPKVYRSNGQYVLDTSQILFEVLQASEKERVENLAASAQHAVAIGLADIAVNVAQDEGVKFVGFTGGVAYNEAITRTIREYVKGSGLVFIEHSVTPPGDAGVSIGQVITAACRLLS
ncbi:MAG: carbamoyltransferase HypF [Candidatus Freyarchaeota archaeon]|nr:carbamoyltransferase HypF [Candidatus Jordarchaeia archaeon]